MKHRLIPDFASLAELKECVAAHLKFERVEGQKTHDVYHGEYRDLVLQPTASSVRSCLAPASGSGRGVGVRQDNDHGFVHR